ncbi:hypothetical protein IFM89_026105 [Coptis chinensis]|uniref:AP complex subunit sigma n=1 Tax=Coptis chinensis TaxID=261450 RepID=A0A835GXY4_9MAGN|nr:hypothetical protein IFM89_026105 [Coptis chinensis]
MIRAVMVINTQGKPRLAKFYEFMDTRLVYKHYATLYFVFVFDDSENELAMLDLIQVCLSQMHMVLNEIIFGGQVLETSSAEVMKAVEEITKLEKTSNAISLVSRSVSSWQS